MDQAIGAAATGAFGTRIYHSDFKITGNAGDQDDGCAKQRK